MVAFKDFSTFDVAVNGRSSASLLRSDDPVVNERIANLRSAGSDKISINERRSVLDELIDSNEFLRAFVADFKGAAGIDLGDADSRDEIAGIVLDIEQRGRKYGEVPNALLGLSGLQTTLFLKSLLFLETRCRISGKIKDYIFCDQSHNGFQKSSENHVGVGSGHLAVEIIIETFNTDREFLEGNPSRREFNHWDIDIRRVASEDIEGFKVFERVGSSNPPNNTNPFPDTVAFPEANTNPANSRSVWCRGLDHKLYAEGQSIEVHHIYQQIDCGHMVLLPRTDGLYTVTDDSCVDLMFRGYPTLSVLPEEDGYCLGRCAHPQIVNSDGV